MMRNIVLLKEYVSEKCENAKATVSGDFIFILFLSLRHKAVTRLFIYLFICSAQSFIHYKLCLFYLVIISCIWSAVKRAPPKE
jgi:hypothetical protein